MTKLDDLTRALVNERLHFYLQLSFARLNPGVEFIDGLYLRAICHALERVAHGEVRRLIIALPPRSLKSEIASVVFPAWVLGRDPTQRLVCASYSNDLATTFGFQTRLIMQDPFYKLYFPDTVLDPRKLAAEKFMTTDLGYRQATSVGGTLTGKGGHILIVDDAMKAEDALSEARRDAAHRWYTGTVANRLDDPKSGAIVVVGQRLHEDDLIGRLMGSGEWEVLCMPAVATGPQAISLGDEMEWKREIGELLHPQRIGQEELDRIRAELGSRNYETQYQQNPAPDGGLLVRTEWFRTYQSPLTRKRYEAVVQSWDTAAVPGLDNDWCVCSTWGLIGKDIHLLDVHRQQHEFTDLLNAARTLKDRWRPEMIVIEGAFSGIDLANVLRREGWREVQILRPKGDKVQRMSSQTPKLEKGHVFLPKSAPWLAPFLAEVAAFPQGKYDDQVDSMSQFLRALDARPGQIRRVNWYR